jgi:hypothetical protein
MPSFISCKSRLFFVRIVQLFIFKKEGVMKKNRMIVVLVCLGFFWGVFASEDGLTVKQRMELIKQREKDAENAAAENAAQRKKGGGRRKSAKPSNEANVLVKIDMRLFRDKIVAK